LRKVGRTGYSFPSATATIISSASPRQRPRRASSPRLWARFCARRRKPFPGCDSVSDQPRAADASKRRKKDMDGKTRSIRTPAGGEVRRGKWGRFFGATAALRKISKRLRIPGGRMKGYRPARTAVFAPPLPRLWPGRGDGPLPLREGKFSLDNTARAC